MSNSSGNATTSSHAGQAALADRFTHVDGVEVVDLLAAGRSLPSSWFHDDEIFALEQERIWRRSWVYVGPVSWATKPGDYFTCDVAGVPLVVVRGTDAVLRAFVNICRHRQHAVLAEIGARGRPNCGCRRHVGI